MSAGPLNDTQPKIEALLIEGYRRMSPSQKLERVRALTMGRPQGRVLMLSEPILVVAKLGLQETQPQQEHVHGRSVGHRTQRT